MSPSGRAVDRSGPPESGPIRPFHLPTVETHDLENGLEVLSMARGGVPLISVCLVLTAGEMRVPLGKGGLAVLTGDALQGGTRTHSGAELAELLEAAGTGLRVSTGWDATTLSFSCVAERVETVLSILSEVASSASFPDEEVERVQRERLSSIRQRRLSPASLADDELDREVFDESHPFHRPLAGDEASVRQLERSELMAFAADSRSSRAGIVLVGDLSPDGAAELAHGNFGWWSSTRDPDPARPRPGGPPEPGITIVHRPGAVQSEIRVGQPGPGRGHPDEMALRVSNLVLGGAFTSRLNLSLREKHGFTYGARSGFEFRKDGGIFHIRTAVQTEVTAPALEETMAVFDEFARTGPSSEEVARARDYLAGVFPLRMETTSQLAARAAELIIFDLPEDYHHTYRDRIRAIGADTAQTAVRTHLDPDRSRIVLVADADKVAPEVEALGLGPVQSREPT